MGVHWGLRRFRSLRGSVLEVIDDGLDSNFLVFAPQALAEDKLRTPIQDWMGRIISQLCVHSQSNRQLEATGVLRNILNNFARNWLLERPNQQLLHSSTVLRRQ